MQVVRTSLAAIGSFSAAYLWAVLLGHGLHGLVIGSAIDHQRNYPGADAALVAALVGYVASPVVAWWLADLWFGMSRWCLVTAAAGLAVFGLTQLAF